MDLASLVDPSLLGGLAAAVVLAGVIISFMKYSFASQEIEYGEHISTLYGTNSALKSKAVKAAEKKKRAKQAKANQAKASSASDTPEDGQYGQHHVEINSEPIILGENEAGGQGQTKTKPRKRKLSKPILHNKDEVPLVQTGEVESRLDFSANTVPVDEAEMLHRKQAQHHSEKPAKASEVDHVDKPLPPANVEVVEETVLPVESANVNAELTQTTNRDRAGSNNQLSSDDTSEPATDAAKKSSRKAETKGVEEFLDSIGQSGLSKAQLEKLVGALVAKHGSGKWERKEKLAELSQQLQLVQSALDKERSNLVWTNGQLKETANKLSLAERNHQLVNAQLQEMQMKLGQNHDQHRAEVQGIQQARFQEIQRMQQHIQQVREENQSLRQALPNTDEVVQMRNQLRALESELQDQQRHLVKSEAKCQDLTSRLNSADEAYRQEHIRCVELVSRSDELSFQHNRLEKQLTDTKTRAHAAETDLRNLQDHLRTKDLEIKELHSEILSATQTTSDMISSTAQADNSKIQQLEDSVKSLQKSVDSKQAEITDLQAQLSLTREELESALKANLQSNGTAVAVDSPEDEKKISQLEHELLKLQSDIDSVRDKNNELRKKNWGISESLQKAEAASLTTSLLESDLEKKSSQVNELKACNQTLREENSELQRKAELLNSADSHSDQLQREHNQLKHVLAEKDDAIRSLEVSLAEEKDKVTSANSLSLDKVSAVMRNLQPSLTLDSSLTLEQSMDMFCKHAVGAKLENPEENPYKQTLIETEAMLDKLSETWQGKLDDKDSHISKLQTELAEYQTKLHNLSLSLSATSQRSSSQHAEFRDEDTDSSSNTSEAMRLASSGSLQDVSSTV